MPDIAKGRGDGDGRLYRSNISKKRRNIDWDKNIIRNEKKNIVSPKYKI
jgi:hypothetical protein